MANEPTIKTFGAADIEKYHLGQLSAGEMHDLEKAALDDPFLADALEGYAAPGVNAMADMAELKKRLAQRTADQKVIPLVPAGRSTVPWLRAAAMIVVVAGAGFLIYRLGFSDKRSDIALAPVEKNQQGNIPGSGQAAPDSNAVGTATDKIDVPAANGKQQMESAGNTSGLTSKAKDNFADPPGVAPAPRQWKDIARGTEGKAGGYDALIAEAATSRKDGLKKKEQTNKPVSDHYRDTTTVVVGYGTQRKEKAFLQDSNRQDPAAGAGRFAEPSRTNIFRGRVTDAHNNALPFANITNTADNIGTYADAKGNFVLTSPDSVLNVQVRSIGFENNTVQLQNFTASNQVTMQEDKSLGEVVISNRQLNSNRSRNNTMVLEEPEPVDGWTNYDTYLANNLVVPETFRSKQAGSGEVELSFEVNRNGEPVNITVDKSLCESCDREAIRLIKEGPKWKRKARKGRTSIRISF